MGIEVKFYNKSSGNYELILWDFGDGNTSTEENPVHVYDNDGEYLVSLTVDESLISTPILVDCPYVQISGSGSGVIYDPEDPGNTVDGTIRVIAVFINTDYKHTETAMILGKLSGSLTVAGRGYTAARMYAENRMTGEMQEEDFFIPLNSYEIYSALVFYNVSPDFMSGGELNMLAANSIGYFVPTQVFFIADDGIHLVTKEYLSFSQRAFSQTWTGDTEGNPWVHRSYHKVVF